MRTLALKAGVFGVADVVVDATVVVLTGVFAVSGVADGAAVGVWVVCGGRLAVGDWLDCPLDEEAAGVLGGLLAAGAGDAAGACCATGAPYMATTTVCWPSFTKFGLLAKPKPTSVKALFSKFWR
ncbi:MAG: hypothetical protein JWO47_642 [Candidatus Saccharibacteria bacterium]|nr:hypothetical protein [Candidatus Saccharibacteria bacterium]